MNSEILIIGGGVIGLSIARELYKKGARRITIVDRGPIGREASWAAAGMLAPNIESGASEDFHQFGRESLELYPDFADALLDETGIAIGLDRTGTLCLAFDEAEAAELGETFERQRSRKVPVERLSSAGARTLEPSLAPGVREALLYPEDWQVDNRKLVSALRKFAEVNGIQIFENAEISELLATGSRIIGAKTQTGDLNAGTTVLATGAWTSLIKIDGAAIGVDVRPVRGQMISFEVGEKFLWHVVQGPRGYVVPRADGRILIGATVEDVGFDKSTTAEGIESLKGAAVGIVPCLGGFEIMEQWAGLRPFAVDGLPVIGNVPDYENVFVATAHYRNGILHAPKTAEIIGNRIAEGAVSKYLTVFGPGRLSSAASSASVP